MGKILSPDKLFLLGTRSLSYFTYSILCNCSYSDSVISLNDVVESTEFSGGGKIGTKDRGRKITLYLSTIGPDMWWRWGRVRVRVVIMVIL